MAYTWPNMTDTISCGCQSSLKSTGRYVLMVREMIRSGYSGPGINAPSLEQEGPLYFIECATLSPFSFTKERFTQLLDESIEKAKRWLRRDMEPMGVPEGLELVDIGAPDKIDLSH
ncbi:hypothetical protein BG011_000544, partial [Mortierella polycephala]